MANERHEDMEWDEEFLLDHVNEGTNGQDAPVSAGGQDGPVSAGKNESVQTSIRVQCRNRDTKHKKEVRKPRHKAPKARVQKPRNEAQSRRARLHVVPRG